MAARNISNWSKFLENVPKHPIRQFSVISTNNVDLNGSQTNTSKSQIHVTAQKKYPVAATLPIPNNIDPAETTRFLPSRSRDITGTAITSHPINLPQHTIDVTLDASHDDPHVESYDCLGAVSLSSVMQSNVPTPFGGMHRFTHLNMPGGQWSQEGKFMSHNLQSSHYTTLRQQTRANWSNYDENATVDKQSKKKLSVLQQVLLEKNIFMMKNNLLLTNKNLHEQIRQFSTESSSQGGKASGVNSKNEQIVSSPSTSSPLPPQSSAQQGTENVEPKLTKREQLKRAVKEYGSTVIIFHIGISLMSLGLFYGLVSSGINVVAIIDFIGYGSSVLTNKVAAGASTFVVAYAIHKVFAPVRISITLFSTPLIVRYLRKKGFLKPKKG